MSPSLSEQGYYHPAEWHPHSACWLAYPYKRSEWGASLEACQREFVELCRAIASLDPITGETQGELLELLVPDRSDIEKLQQQMESIPVRFHLLPYDDIWLRDSGPIFVRTPAGQVAAVRFQFNAWGNKFAMPHDAVLAAAISKSTGLPVFEYPLVLEGGSIDADGEGTCLTTRQCLLNPNRNPTVTQPEIERILSEALGYQKFLWLEEGLLNDHTDGHIDTIARFIAPGVVLCMHPAHPNDPNQDVLERIRASLESMTDAKGRTLKVVTIPSPGRVLDEEGEILAASYVNFYIGNRTVVVPTYGVPYDQEAIQAIAPYFPDRRTVGCSAKAIVSGGGAFHCITQQQLLPVAE
jgi:agmatine deiminase